MECKLIRSTTEQQFVFTDLSHPLLMARFPHTKKLNTIKYYELKDGY